MKGTKLGNLLSGISRIGLDSSTLIYYFENESRYGALTNRLFNRVAGGLEAVLSAVTVMEVMVKPFRAGPKTVDVVARKLKETSNFIFIPASFEIALEAARLRSRYGLKAPDALQLATSIVSDAQVFLTNDGGFRAAAHKEAIKIVLLEDCRE